MKEILNNLYKQVTTMNAGEGHVELDVFKDDPKATAVISMYHDQRPANKVLDELWNWAEENNYLDVMEKIRELEEM